MKKTKVFWCKTCLNMSTRPRIEFDSNGSCNACLRTEEKKTINWNKRNDELELLLDGEKEPLHVKVNHYRLNEENGRHYLVGENIVTSRAWINTVASQYLHGQKFEIPQEYAKLLKIVV